MDEIQREIGRRLVSQGRQLWKKRSGFVEFTGDRAADELLNDFDNYPHAFVIGAILDRQIPAERAWQAPLELKRRLGTFKFEKISRLTEARIYHALVSPTALHRFNKEMARNIHQALGLIRAKYQGNAARIWEGKPASAEVVLAFLDFRGVGPKIATMAANILARHFKVPFSDYTCIDISADVQVKRVFERLRLAPVNPSVEFVRYVARAHSPEFPGLLDLPAWEIGKNWCRRRQPLCSQCYMGDICPTAPGSWTRGRVSSAAAAR